MQDPAQLNNSNRSVMGDSPAQLPEQLQDETCGYCVNPIIPKTPSIS